MSLAPSLQSDIATRAAAMGFTTRVCLEGPSCDLEGWVRPGTDYDDRFAMVEEDTGETLWVNGWLCSNVTEEG